MANEAKAKSGKPSHPRAGVYRRQPTNYWAFIPTDLPPIPPIDFRRIEPQLSEANVALGKLDGIGAVIPNPDLFVRMFGRKEAVLSSQIEGTMASLSDLLEEEAKIPLAADKERPSDVDEVLNYVKALNAGLERLEQLPLSLRLIREMHAVLLQGVRGKDKTPGEFRRSQNWIGSEGASLDRAVFIPPPPAEMMEALGSFEKFLRAEDDLPVLIRAGLVHAQFESIHPFLDGNGRLGRLLVTFMLAERRILSRPLLYLSFYLKKHKHEYYAHLMAVREKGEWEEWLRFFLNGIQEVSLQGVDVATRVLALQRRDKEKIQDAMRRKSHASKLLDYLYRTPTTMVGLVANSLKVSVPTANSLMADFVALGILREISGRERDRIFRHVEYLSLLTPEE